MPRFLKRFGVRTLLILIGWIAVGLGFWLNIYQPRIEAIADQHSAVAHLTALNHTSHPEIEFEWRVIDGPDWLQWVLGDYYFTEVVAIDFGTSFGRVRPVKPKDLAMLARFRSLENLTLNDVTIDNTTIQHLKPLKKLQTLQIRQRLPRIRIQITNDGLESLSGLPNLQVLSIDEDNLTEACLIHLRDLDRLRNLRLNFPVTDTGIQLLMEIDTFRSNELELDRLPFKNISEQSRAILPRRYQNRHLATTDAPP